MQKKIDYKKIIEFGWMPDKRTKTIFSYDSKEYLCLLWYKVTGRQYNDNSEFLYQAKSIEILFFASEIFSHFGARISIADIVESKKMIFLMDKIDAALQFEEVNCQPIRRERYKLTQQQMAFYASSQLYGVDFYRFTHLWQLPDQVDLKGFKECLWQNILKIPELRASIDQEGTVVIAKLEDCIKEEFICDSNSLLSPFTKFENGHPIERAKFSIIKMDSALKFFAINIHHIFFDHLSINKLVSSCLSNQCIDVNQSMSDCSLIEARLLSEMGANNLSYFLKTCNSALPLSFPTRRTRKESYTISSYKYEFDFSSKNVPIQELTLAAFAYVLLGYSSTNKSFIFGIARTLRDVLSGASVCAPLFNILPVVIDAKSISTVDQWLEHIHQQLKSAEQHKIYELDGLIEGLGLPHVFGQHRIFPVLFIWHEANSLPYEFSTAHTEHDIIFYCSEDENHIKIKVDCANELFDRSQIDALINGFKRCLLFLNSSESNFPLDKKILAKSFPFLAYPSVNEKQSIGNLQEMYSRIKSFYPELPAIITSSSIITYQELTDRVSECVQVIKRHFFGHKAIVLSFDDRLKYLISLLASIELGYCFIPVLPEQLQYIASKYSLLGNQVPIFTDNLELLTLDNVVFFDSQQKSPVLRGSIVQELIDVAYVMFTSGSTGTPKGVKISKDGFCNILLDFENRLNLSEKTRFLAHSSSAFDISLLEFLLPIFNGGTCVLTAREGQKDLSALISFSKLHACNVIQATPTTWQLLLDLGWDNPDNATLLSGGENLTEKLASQLLSLSSSVWNVYGPTETTIWSLVSKLEHVNQVTLGVPISNTQIYIQNKQGFVNVPGSYGELVICGSGVFLGYLGQGQSSECYRTGDLVWLETDSLSLKFIGRNDCQIKRFSKRIYLTEIEHALLGCDLVKEVYLVTYYQYENLFIAAILPGLTESQVNQVKLWSKISLPKYLQPDFFYLIDSVPLNYNAKADYKKLQEIVKIKTGDVVIDNVPDQDLLTWIKNWCKHCFCVDVLGSDNFFSIGGNSLLATKFATDLSVYLQRPISTTTIFRYPSFSFLVEALMSNTSLASSIREHKVKELDKGSKEKIAIVGLSLRLPGVNDLAEFWRLLELGGITITEFSKEELLARGCDKEYLADSTFRPVGSEFSDIWQFDNEFFQMSPKESVLTDPQHRILYELSWQALEDACIVLSEDNNDIGVYSSCYRNGYQERASSRTGKIWSKEALVNNILTDADYLATKLAFKLGLRGPAVAINTACSGGLTCIQEASKALLSWQAEAMLVSVASISLPDQVGYLYKDGHTFSASGMCRPFTENADGTVPGSGAIAVVLKRFSDAMADGTPIYAVIEGAATNNDGKRKVSYTAPSSVAHAECAKQAIASAGLEPSDIALVEAHGTGTKIGDPIEIEGLGAGYFQHQRNPIKLSSVKANIGHTNMAAGLFGLAKLCLARSKNKLVGMPCSAQPISQLKDLGFELFSGVIPWPEDCQFAGISSLGIGGTNNHLVIGPEPVPQINFSTNQPYLLLLSAKTSEALWLLRKKILKHLKENKESIDEIYLHRLCKTYMYGRSHFSYRFACLFFSKKFLFEKLLAKNHFVFEEHLIDNQLFLEAENWLAMNQVSVTIYPKNLPFLHAPTYAFSHNRKFLLSDLKKAETVALNTSDDKLDVFNKLIKGYFEDVLGYEDVDLDANFFSLGGDSLSALDLIEHIENKLAISLSIDELQSTGSPSSIAKLMRNRQQKDRSAHLVRFNQGKTLPLLILIHPGNGNVYHYRSLAELLHAHYQVVAVSYPVGQEDYSSIAEMASAYVRLIGEQLDLTIDYDIGGWSYGATIAHEMVYQMEQNGDYHLPRRLFLFDGWVCYSRKLLDKKRFFEAIDLVDGDEDSVLWLDTFWDKISNRLRMLIEHEPRLVNVKAVLIKAASYPKLYVSKDLCNNGWDLYLGNPCQTYVIEGDHNKLMQQPCVESVAKIIKITII